MNIRAGCLALCMLVIGLAWGAEPATYRLKIPEQALGDALQEFSRQSGVQIIFFSGVTEGQRAPALDGQYTMSAALEALLANSKLTFRVINAKTVEVTTAARPQSYDKPDGLIAPPRAKKTRRSLGAANGAAQRRPIEEVIVTATAEGLVATRTATPLREIPQTVSIISREQIRQQNDTNLADALRRAPGITVVRRTSQDQQFYSRGFPIATFHVDGGAALTSRILVTEIFPGTPDLSEFDHIEVLRGADALFGGKGNPGGTVSLVRKRPLDAYRLTLDVAGGSWNNQRIEVDVSGPLALDGALRGRLDALYADPGFFQDSGSLERQKIFAVLEYDFTPEATLTAGGSYQVDDTRPIQGGLPLYADGTDSRLDRDTALTFDWAHDQSHMRELYLQYRQDFAGDWQVKLNAAAWRGKTEFRHGGFDGPIDPRTQVLRSLPDAEFSTRPNAHRQSTVDLTLTGSFDWLGRRHEVAVGGDYTDVEVIGAADAFFDFGPAPTDLRAFDASAYPDPRGTRTPNFHLAADATLRQNGLFASWRTYLNDDWSLVGGARIGSDRDETSVSITSGPIGGSATASHGNSRIVTPYAGVMVDLNEHYSLYASYAAIYLTLGNTQWPDGTPLPTPTTGVDIEAGIKGSWRNGALNGSLVVYRTDQSDVPVQDLGARRLAGQLQCCFHPETSKSEGFDLELSGELAPGWLIGSGYSFNRNEAAWGGVLSSATPRHQLKLWTSKQLPGVLDRWTIGGNLYAQSSNSVDASYCPQVIFNIVCTVDSVPVRATQDAYAVLDVRVGFAIAPNWQAALTVGNVFDEIYYQTLDESLVNNWYGEPRSVTLRIEGSY